MNKFILIALVSSLFPCFALYATVNTGNNTYTVDEHGCVCVDV